MILYVLKGSENVRLITVSGPRAVFNKLQYLHEFNEVENRIRKETPCS